MEEDRNKRNALASLTDNAVLEIFCRLPASSLFCCKCVCRTWNRLINDYNNHKVLPRTLASFFYDFDQGHRLYTRVTGEHPSLSFLPFTFDNVAVSDICNGLILCWCRGADGLYRYVVCSPTTKEKKELPPSIHSVGEARLGFDPSTSSHFHVIEFIQEEPDDECKGVDIYSSKTAAPPFHQTGKKAAATNPPLRFARTSKYYQNLSPFVNAGDGNGVPDPTLIRAGLPKYRVQIGAGSKGAIPFLAVAAAGRRRRRCSQSAAVGVAFASNLQERAAPTEPIRSSSCFLVNKSAEQERSVRVPAVGRGPGSRRKPRTQGTPKKRGGKIWV